MINMVSQNGDVKYNVVEFVVDMPADIKNLPTTVAMGSSALVLSNSEVYVLNGEKEWVKI